MAKLLNYGFEVSEFTLYSGYYVHFLTNDFGKYMISLNLTDIG